MKPNFWQILGLALLIVGLIWILVERLTDEDAPSPGPESDVQEVAPGEGE
jgi:hypothetical protein